jgi:hypothetical protein
MEPGLHLTSGDASKSSITMYFFSGDKVMEKLTLVGGYLEGTTLTC